MCTVLGVLYGAGTSVLNHTGPGFVAMVLGHATAWAGFGLLVAWVLRRVRSRGLRRCALGVVAVYLTAVLAYYTSDVLIDLPGVAQTQYAIEAGEIPPLPEGTPVHDVPSFVLGQAGDALIWLFGAVAVSGPVALAGALMARGDTIGLIARLSAPAVLVTAVLMMGEAGGTLAAAVAIAAIWSAVVLVSAWRSARSAAPGTGAA